MAYQIPPAPTGVPPGHSFWNAWYEQLRDFINQGLTTVQWPNIDFAGSNITDLVSRAHNDLQSTQGGTVNEKYHLTSAQHGVIASGLSVTITTAKLTPGGSNGSMTFTNGILTAQTPAT